MVYVEEKVYLLKFECLKIFLHIIVRWEELFFNKVFYYINLNTSNTFTPTKRKQNKTKPPKPKTNPAICKDIMIYNITCLTQGQCPSPLSSFIIIIIGTIY